MRIAIDTNLLVLLVVGSASRDFIERHKRTKTYSPEDFDLLSDCLRGMSSLIVSPNVLTETSNLVRQTGEPARRLLSDVLSKLIETSEELYIASAEAVRQPDYRRLGLTDAVVVACQDEDVLLLTDDLDLYLASISAGRTAINFAHLRDERLGRS